MFRLICNTAQITFYQHNEKMLINESQKNHKNHIKTHSLLHILFITERNIYSVQEFKHELATGTSGHVFPYT